MPRSSSRSQSPRPTSAGPASAGPASAGRVFAVIACLMSLLMSTAGCAGRHKGPRTLATAGAALIVVGGTTWVLTADDSDSAFVPAGFALTAVGAVAVLAAGGWLTLTAGCITHADCIEGEECREVPAPPGGVPYSQCVPRT